MNIRRLIVLFIPLMVASFVIFFRVIDIQLIRGEYFRKLADENRFFTVSVLAPRGVFLDRYSDPLVKNIKTYYKIDAGQLFSQRLELPREEALINIASDSSQIAVKYFRNYIWGQSLSHALGYVGEVTSEDLEQDSYLPLDTQLGRVGLEKKFQDSLVGVEGQQVYEIDALGRKKRLVSSVPETSGHSFSTSLDPYLSQLSFSLLEGKKGAIIISDAHTGQILSLVSQPSFDPNTMANTPSDLQEKKARLSQIQTWTADEDQPFFNRAVSGIYPPGSIFKIVTALAGLESNKVNNQTTVVDEGVLKVGDYEYGNWYFRQYGRTEGEIGLRKAIARSNDIFFYKVAEWVGPDNLAETARLFGFGVTPNIEIPQVAAGIVPDPAWKEREIGEKWFLGNTYHFGIGQGDILTSPLQINQLIQTIANDGSLCPPTVLQQSPQCYGVGVTTENIDKVIGGMLDACSTGGTAYPFFTHNERVFSQVEEENIDELINQGAVACKTGTAEFGGVNEDGYRNTHAWFVGILTPKISQDNISGFSDELTELRRKWLEKIQEKEFPEKITITVLVESDEEKLYREGSQDAAPIAAEILRWIDGW